MRNILDAIVTIHNQPALGLQEINDSNNRINVVGDALEHFIKDAFADTFDKTNEQRKQAHESVFSWVGNVHNPPDVILKGGDAIEIKKREVKSTESFGGTIALNSSYPKNKLYASNPMLTKSCRECEDWHEKDLVYAVGIIKQKKIQALCFVYGDVYAAGYSVYERIRETIKRGVESIPDVDFADSAELGRVNRVDPLGITNLRIRGMWEIETPFRLFRDMIKSPFFAIMTVQKYNSFLESSRQKILGTEGISVEFGKVSDPDNPAKNKEVVLISFGGKI